MFVFRKQHNIYSNSAFFSDQGVNGTFGFLWHGCDNPSAGYYRYTLDERIHSVEEAVDMEDMENYFDSEVHSSDGIVHMCATDLCNTIITDFSRYYYEHNLVL